MKTIIEFAGLPGTGKTTILNELSFENIEKINTIEFYKILDSKKRFIWILKFVFSIIFSFNMKKAFLLRFKYYKTIKTKIIRNSLNSLFYYYLLQSNIKKSKKQIIMLDQGILQNEWTILIRNDINMTEKIANLMINILNQSYKRYAYYVIYITGEIEQIVKQAKNRNQNPDYDGLKQVELLKKYNDHKYDINFFSKKIKNIKKVKNSLEIYNYLKEVRNE